MDLGTLSHVMEPKLPGVVESYVDLGRFYDRAGLEPLRAELEAAGDGYRGHYKRAYRCLTAAAQLAEDSRALLLTPALEAKALKRARGILGREIKKTGRQTGRAAQRFLSGITSQGQICLFETADTMCRRVYELSDSWGMAAGMIAALASGAMSAGYDVILSPSPLFPERAEHLLIPELSLAFLTSTPALPYPGRPDRRIRVDAMADAELLHQYKGRLKFSKRVQAALMQEAVEALAEAKASHDRLEALYNPHVDFGGVYRQADELSRALLTLT